MDLRIRDNYCDNYFTRPALVAKLYKLGFRYCGTARYNTQGIPHAANPKKHQMRKGDDPKYFVKGGQMCIVWQDKKSVTLLTNVGNSEVIQKANSVLKELKWICGCYEAQLC